MQVFDSYTLLTRKEQRSLVVFIELPLFIVIRIKHIYAILNDFVLQDVEMVLFPTGSQSPLYTQVPALATACRLAEQQVEQEQDPRWS